MEKNMWRTKKINILLFYNTTAVKFFNDANCVHEVITCKILAKYCGMEKEKLDFALLWIKTSMTG